MLHFETKPDKVFTAILHKALERARAEISEVLDDRDEFEVLYPNLGRCFDPGTALSTIEQLLRASRSPKLYQLTDYHWLILHEALRVFTDAHNDFAQEDPEYDTKIGAYRLGEIDFDGLIDLYFSDLDFTLESYPLSPEDLRLVRVEDSDWAPDLAEPDPEIFRSDSIKYPDWKEV